MLLYSTIHLKYMVKKKYTFGTWSVAYILLSIPFLPAAYYAVL